MSGAVYVNPFVNAGTVTPGRLDQGQDFNLAAGAPIGAIGRAKVLQVQSNWYKGQPAIFYELLDGPRKGEVYYLAEQIVPVVTAGQEVQPGQTLAHYAGSGTGIEYGIGTRSGQTLAQATTGYSEGQVTPAAEAFTKQLGELGGTKPKGSSSGGKCGFLGPASFVCKPAELAEEGTEAALGLVGEGASSVGKDAAEGIIGLVKPVATKITVYAVLIFAAVGMIVFGFSKLLEPVGGPKLGGAGLGRLAGGKGGAVPEEAALAV